MRKLFGLIGLTIFLQGCVTSSLDYTPPRSQTPPENEVKIDEPFETVWDRMVKNLSQEFFVINNIEKESRLMNVSFSTSSPENYIDCGRSFRTFENLAGKRNFAYLVAGNGHYQANNQFGAFDYYRTTSLDGRGNIYVAPEGDGTLVRVNNRYILSIGIRAVRFDGVPGGQDKIDHSFNTKEVLRVPDKDGTLICVSKGTLEDLVLEAAQG